ncbi:DUF5977 domain-containing protein [Parasediminibacterium sp. JCM 36343]|uniref:DUF5977 domain-containing protein n=1 Tax=Parasediminibacterium sp. JCM 36343 TaxID=3374279 RepID=UPI00397BCEA1
MKAIIYGILFLFVTKSSGQVNLQTGSATFGLPIFSWQDDKSRLTAPVSLNYNSGNGLSVNQVATNVGTGWGLVAGGVITRMQVGEPDDQKPYINPVNSTESIDDITKYPAGYLYSNANVEYGCPNILTLYPIFKDKNHLYKPMNSVTADRELDYFSFMLNGRTGLFILDKGTLNASTGIGSGVCLGDSKLKIKFTTNASLPNTRTTIVSFSIQDETGVTYHFNKYGTTQVLKSNFCDESLKHQITQPKLESDRVYHEAGFVDASIKNPTVINSWYLTEIDDALTKDDRDKPRKIIFDYPAANDRHINAVAGTDIAFYDKGYAILTHKTSVTVTPTIGCIRYPDGHKVVFNYGADRVDMVGDKVLSSIDIFYNNRYLSKYQLNTTYFLLSRYGIPKDNDDALKKVARLCLHSVIQYGVDVKGFNEPYVFDYYFNTTGIDNTGKLVIDNNAIVPPPFCAIKDIWGYYNGSLSKDEYNSKIPMTKDLGDMTAGQLKYLCYLNKDGKQILNPNSGYAQNGLLKQITYPAGGFITYYYEQNKGNINGQVMVGGVHVCQTRVADGGVGSSNDCSHPMVTHYAYHADGDASTSSLWGVEAPVNKVTTGNHYNPESKHFYYRPLFHLGCEYRIQYPGILSREQAVSLSKQEETMATMAEVLSVVGDLMTIVDVINVVLDATPLAIVAVIIDIIGFVAEILFSCLSNVSKEESSAVYYNSALNACNPLPSQFKRVEVIQGTGGIGKTVFDFTNPETSATVDAVYPVWEADNLLYSMKQRYAYWAYGLPSKTTVYDASSNKVKETENNYDYSNAKKSFSTGTRAYPSAKCMVGKSSSQRYDDWQSTDLTNQGNFSKTSNTYLGVDIYDVYTGRIELATTYERVYSTADPSKYVESKTEYGYDPDNYQVNHIKTTQSNGRVVYKDFYFSCDTYTNPGILNTLKQNNILNAPVKTVVSLDIDVVEPQTGADNLKNKPLEDSIRLLNSFAENDNLSSAGHGPSNNENLTGQQDGEAKPTKKAGATTSRYCLSETVTEYKQLANGDIKPYRALVERTDEPVFKNYWKSYDGPAATINSVFQVTQLSTYDDNGNLIGIKDEGNHTVSNIYNYDDKYVVASVINAEAFEPSYTSFEYNQAQGGAWVSTGTVDLIDTKAVTGKYSCSLSASSGLSATIANTTKPYTLSFWATSELTVTTGTTLVKHAPTVNGFTYYEYTIPAGTASVSINATSVSAIDEVRLYPKAARMRTVAYDPLIGKTVDCDENNRLTYYEYDELGRLRFTKDDYGNIVKMQEYNTVRKQSVCPLKYKNYAITQQYTKNDCGAGHIGEQVSYSIAAGKFESTISQIDADIQAQHYLDENGQQAANDNGGCILMYYNVAKSQAFTNECTDGYAAQGTVTYSVPAGAYSSTVDQATVDALAQTEIDANGQQYANAHGVCVIDTSADWVAVDPTLQYQCELDGSGHNTGYESIYMQNINPSSSTYLHFSWILTYPDANITACPVYVPPRGGCGGNIRACTECQKYINCQCENGVIVFTERDVYHLEWSDGSWSQNYRGTSACGNGISNN